jgi:hypothetical protein
MPTGTTWFDTRRGSRRLNRDDAAAGSLCITRREADGLPAVLINEGADQDRLDALPVSVGGPTSIDD